MWDLNYFKYCFLKATGINFNESDLEDDFEEMTDILLSASSDTFMYRDFQSRNVIIKVISRAAMLLSKMKSLTSLIFREGAKVLYITM